MASVYLGWVLISLGVLTYLVALIAYTKGKFFTKLAEPVRVDFRAEADETERLKQITEMVKAVNDFLEKFGKLSDWLQLGIFGLLQIAGGAYLLATTPF